MKLMKNCGVWMMCRRDEVEVGREKGLHRRLKRTFSFKISSPSRVYASLKLIQERIDESRSKDRTEEKNKKKKLLVMNLDQTSVLK
jgi:hypothetical protein